MNKDRSQWYRLNGNQLDFSLEETILSDISKTSKDLKFYIGSDSHTTNKKTIFSVVLVILKKGRGGIGYYKRILENNSLTTHQRLFQETYYAVELATKINPLLESIGHKIEEIHTDLNPNPRSLFGSVGPHCANVNSIMSSYLIKNPAKSK